METAEILKELSFPREAFVDDAVRAALARQEEITPELLRILEDTVDRAAELTAEDSDTAHLYAMFLLAQFRETRAYPLVVRFAMLPGELPLDLAGDFVHEHLGQILASVCGGDLGGIRSVIESEEANEWARSAALDSLVVLMVTGHNTREEVMAYFVSLFRGKLAREYSAVWDSLVCHSADLWPQEVMADIEQAYEEGLVDPNHVSPKDVQEALEAGLEACLAKLAKDHHRQLVTDTVKEMARWTIFRDLAPYAFTCPEEDIPMAPVQTYIKPPTPGRNDPCSCGSGKKYKKCCGG